MEPERTLGARAEGGARGPNPDDGEGRVTTSETEGTFRRTTYGVLALHGLVCACACDAVGAGKDQRRE
jgi:hypothetical protein